MQERLTSMSPSDPRKEGLSAAFQELVRVCAEEYEKMWSPPELELVHDEEKVDTISFIPDEDDVNDIFHDALEDQEAQEESGMPLSQSTVYGVQSTDWALHRSPSAGAPDMSTEWTMKRSPTAKYQDSGQKRSSKCSGHWYSPSSYSNSRRSAFPAAIQKVV